MDQLESSSAHSFEFHRWTALPHQDLAKQAAE
jgi:hypothetical protein